MPVRWKLAGNDTQMSRKYLRNKLLFNQTSIRKQMKVTLYLHHLQWVWSFYDSGISNYWENTDNELLTKTFLPDYRLWCMS